MGQRLMAIVAEGTRGRIYLPPTEEMEAIAASGDADLEAGHGVVPASLVAFDSH